MELDNGNRKIERGAQGFRMLSDEWEGVETPLKPCPIIRFPLYGSYCATKR